MSFRPEKRNRGSLTVEAVLVIPIIIFVLFWLLNIAFILYQYAALQNIANQAVEAAQSGWDNTSKDISSGRLENSKQLDDEWLYWNVADKDCTLKESSLKNWVMKRLQKDSLMAIFAGEVKQGNVIIEINELSILSLRRTLEIRITDKRSTLFSPLRSMFGVELTDQVTVVSRGNLQDPAEFIRNLDWSADLYSEHLKNNPDGGLAEASRKIGEIKAKCIDLLK